MSSNTLTVSLVTAEDGSVDQDATSEAFQSALSAHIADRETQMSTVAEAVQAQFSKSASGYLTLPTLANLACASLNVQPENYSVMSELCKDYVRANSKGETSLFQIEKGRGRGVKIRTAQ